MKKLKHYCCFLIDSFDTKSLFVQAKLDKVYVNPDFDFTGYSQVYVEVTEGAVVDTNGNSFPGINDDSWNFEGLEPEIQELIIGVELDAPNNRSYKDAPFIRYEYSLQRSDNNQKMICKAQYSGIQNKSQRYLFPIGGKEILMRFRLRRKQLKKLRAIGSDHNITIDVTCSDGSSDSKTVKISI